MDNKNFTVSFMVNQSASEVFNAINSVTKWWTENLEGNSEKLNDEFSVRFGDVHYSKQQLVELIPARKVTWLVTDSRLNFLEDKEEWTGTRISFDITEEDGKTKLNFTHIGLVPSIQCYNNCSTAWSDYINHSLYQLITTGQGQPAVKETENNKAI